MKRSISILSVFSLMIAISCSGTSSTSQKRTTLLPPLGDKIYFGAFPDFGGSEDNVPTERIRFFENIVDKNITWACFSQNWFNGITYPKQAVHTIHDAGIMPYVRLMPRTDEDQGHPEQTFTMQNIISGKFDKKLKNWAQDAKMDNIPILVDFAVEMNGDWFPWSDRFTGGSTKDKYGDKNYPGGPERYRDVYRHIIDIFGAEGVSNVTWVFHVITIFAFPTGSPAYFSTHSLPHLALSKFDVFTCRSNNKDEGNFNATKVEQMVKQKFSSLTGKSHTPRVSRIMSQNNKTHIGCQTILKQRISVL